MQQKKENLEKIIEELEKKVHQIVTEDREGQFLVDHRGQDVVLMMMNGGKNEGKLVDMDKNRICINFLGDDLYFYKHAISGYHCKFPRNSED